jgi:PBSX family phage terminase large subunit
MSSPSNSNSPFLATEKQLEVARAWFSEEPKYRVVLFGGAIRSGKTQSAARLLVETALETPGTYLVARLTYRELKDTTQKAILQGDGSLGPLLPPGFGEYRASDEMVRLVNGSEILFRSLDDPGKLLNLTLNAVFIDQIEELDPGPDGERVFDTLMGRLSDPRGPRKLLAVANPSGTTHWVYRRLVNEKTRDPGACYVHVELTDNRAHLPADYIEAMEATKESRPHWYRAFILGEWGSFEGAAYPDFDNAIHVVEEFIIPDEWERFESMDHGVASPTAWYAWAVDHDGNLVIFDEYYTPGLVSTHAAEILRRRAGSLPDRRNWWQGRDHFGRPLRHYTYADPSIKAATGLGTTAKPASVLTEYISHGFKGLVGANNDRQAGFARVGELLRPDPERPFPSWHPRYGEYGSPRLFIFNHCENLIEQIRSAPIAADGNYAGRAVDRKWEGNLGHAHASLRYGALSWHKATPVWSLDQLDPEDKRAQQLFDDNRKYYLWRMKQRDKFNSVPRKRYLNV